MCFFSYATVEQLKRFFKNKGNAFDDEFAFKIIDQPFPTKWLGQ